MTRAGRPNPASRLTALLALWLMLFGAVAPTASQVLAKATGQGWIEICSAEGIRQVPVDFDNKDNPGAPVLKAHCPFCTLQNHAPVIPVLTAPAPMVAFSAPALQAWLRSTPPYSPPLSRDHPPRAPPALA